MTTRITARHLLTAQKYAEVQALKAAGAAEHEAVRQVLGLDTDQFTVTELGTASSPREGLEVAVYEHVEDRPQEQVARAFQPSASDLFKSVFG